MAKKAAAARWRLKEVSITDFRGVVGTQKYTFEGMPSLVWGPNGVGKSTLALALEWTLFGDFPSNAYGAPRDTFLAPVGGPAKACKGEVVFVRGNEELSVRREWESGLEVACGKLKKEGDEAALYLDATLGLDKDTFVRSVLLQQSKIRGLLLDEPKERTKALDRLLGMDSAEASLEAIKSKPFKDAAAAWRKDIQGTEQHFQSQSELLERRYKNAEAAARDHKFLGKDLNNVGLKTRYRDIDSLLKEISKKYAVAHTPLADVETIASTKKTSSTIDNALSRIRLESDSAKKLGALNKAIGALSALGEEWEEIFAEHKTLQEQVTRLIKDEGDIKAIKKRRSELAADMEKLEERVRTASELRTLLVQARQYFKSQKAVVCPVCEEDLKNPGKVLQSLKDRVTALATKNIQDAERELEKASKRLEKVVAIEEELTDAQEELDEAHSKLDSERKKIMKTIGVEGLVDKMVSSALKKAISEKEVERNSLAKGQESMEKDLQAISQLDRSIRDALVPYLEARDAMAAHEKAWKDAKSSYAKAEDQAVALEATANDIEMIRKAILAAKDEIATETLGKARPRAQALYTALVKHSLFDQLEVKTSAKANRVEYSFEVSGSKVNKSAREARLVLSDGQLTAAALSLFFALAETGRHNLDLLYIDDPTQNLDHFHKEAMAKVIGDLALRKQVIVSSQDEDFVTLLRDSGFDGIGVFHHIKSWDGKPDVKTRMPATTK